MKRRELSKPTPRAAEGVFDASFPSQITFSKEQRKMDVTIVQSSPLIWGRLGLGR